MIFFYISQPSVYHSLRSVLRLFLLFAALQPALAMQNAVHASSIIESKINAYETKGKYLTIKDVTSRKGISIWVVEDHSLPVISLRFAFSGSGSMHDTVEKQGLARLVSNTMDEGAGDMDSHAFQKTLSDHAITLRFDASRDNYSGHVKTLSKNKETAFSLLKLALTKPRFDSEPVERMRQSNLSRIRHDMTDPEWMAARLSNDIVFEGHPYALNSGGTLTSLKKITQEDLRNFVKESLTLDRLKVVVAGDVNAEDIAATIDDIFGDLPAGSSQGTSQSATVQNQGTVTLYKKDIPQSLVEISMPGIRQDHHDYAVAEVMNFIFGGAGFGSRLMDEIREKRGLTYGIYSGLSMMAETDTIEISASTKNESAAEMIALIKAEMDKMARTAPSDEEVQKAINYLIGSVPLDMTSTDKISSILLHMTTHCIDPNYFDKRENMLRQVKPANILRLSQQYLDPKRMTIVVVGNPANLKPDNIITTLPNVE